MTDKKDPGKFTIRFNICDPQHKAVIDLLNRQGRSKVRTPLCKISSTGEIEQRFRLN